MTDVNTEAMYNLASFLETVPPEDFDLTAWQATAPIDAIRIGPITFRRGCGFSGCAMGWAAYSGKFPGLRLDRDGDLVYRGSTDFEAAAKFLGVSVRVAEFFFVDDNYKKRRVDPHHVASRLRRFAEIVSRRLTPSVPTHEPEVSAARRLRVAGEGVCDG